MAGSVSRRTLQAIWHGSSERQMRIEGEVKQMQSGMRCEEKTALVL